jgi:hypothetical protein
MVSRRLLWGATICSLLLGMLGLLLYARQRAERCLYVPLLAEELLPNADLRADGDTPGLPRGWIGATSGVSLTNFSVLPDGRSLQLIGIANAVQTPLVAPVHPGRSYCFQGQAITDSPLGSATLLRVAFQWLDAAGQLLREDRTPWQPVVLWREDRPPAGWSLITAAFVAPEGARSLRVRLHPASDDRVYLDQMHVRAGGAESGGTASTTHLPAPVTILPWPRSQRAALSFSFDWETAMGGLVHSRSVDDPNFDQDPLLRGMRMRAGVTTTLELFRPHGIRATYYANGYNFLLGNLERRSFMGNPTFGWAGSAPGHRWLSERWARTPWFADDPYGTAASHPAWYFGDLVPLLLRERQDIQSHTFSHLYGGFASPAEWRADLEAWRQVAAERGVPPARSLAFPWSGSGGMSYDSWEELERAGIRSVTRTSGHAPYRLVSYRDPHCRPVPGHERILACPDFYLTPNTADEALTLIDATLAVSGTLDLWAHTEEVTSPAQIAAWKRVVDYAASRPGLWIAPLAEIVAWQAAVAELSIEDVELRSESRSGDDAPALRFRLRNGSARDLEGVTLGLPFAPQKIAIGGNMLNSQFSMLDSLELDLGAGRAVEVALWR